MARLLPVTVRVGVLRVNIGPALRHNYRGAKAQRRKAMVLRKWADRASSKLLGACPADPAEGKVDWCSVLLVFCAFGGWNGDGFTLDCYRCFFSGFFELRLALSTPQPHAVASWYFPRNSV